jgi:hypothetical protein
VNKACALADIIDQLDGLDVDECARIAFRSMVLEVGARHGIPSIQHTEQIVFIRRLLALQVSRPTIRDRTIALYGVSRRQAYRLIHEALEARQ